MVKNAASPGFDRTGAEPHGKTKRVVAHEERRAARFQCTTIVGRPGSVSHDHSGVTLVDGRFVEPAEDDPLAIIGGVTARPIKVLIAKPGLDGHDRGAKVLARGLRDEGFEVIYTGLRQTPEMVVSAALQEDVDVVGLSILSGAHMTLLPKICAGLRERGMDDVLVTAGGIIPDDDIPALEQAGVTRVFGPGTTIREVAEFIRTNVKRREV
jgi:methylmalonyl-CoA mutase C-terminal domain/subunit